MVFTAPIHDIEGAGSPAFDDAGAVEHLGDERIPGARFMRLRQAFRCQAEMKGTRIAISRRSSYIATLTAPPAMV